MVMTDRQLLPPPTKDLNAAKRQFVEIYGSTAVMNTYLKIALLSLCGVCLGLIALQVKTYETFRNFKPLVIRINELGRAEAVTYSSLEYHPQEAEIKYFLIQFVEQHYGRMRVTLQENYGRSLYFLDGRLADALIEANKKSKTIEGFLAGQGEEIEIRVKNVSIEDLRSPPYRATVDFEKIYSSPADHMEIRREKYIGNFVFIVRDHVPNGMIPINPLGVTITYFREDQAFQ
jgi:type IV secretory pathway TrbF-like protein